MKDFTFPSHGVSCAAWHVPATTDALADADGRPCVVMGHGFGGTRDSGLLDYAEPFAAAGIDALVFDYRGFGDSEGLPRQDVSVIRQRQDYHAAIAAARHLPGVDSDRIALWGYSYGGGHVIAVAAQDPHIAATVSMNPAMDGRATLARILRQGGGGLLARLTGHGLRDMARAVTKRSPHLVPVVGQPGTTAMITAPGAEEAYYAMAGPTARNEVCARHALQVALNRPVTFASHLACPMLMQVGTNDAVVPPRAARRAAEKAGYWAQLREYPIDHLDVFGDPWRQQALADQLDFLTRVLDPSRASDIHLRAVAQPQRSGRRVLKLPWLVS
ncbi:MULTISPECIES: alpha/beta hydrolase [unclassified Mycobacterium]|uniref:alpha/beta hydrolase n=1 Tax=unclassified Mycobacterium TaxID=2642494 RepID=UPI0007403288|nr:MULTISPECIES: alpha/beta hydrolase [unclassified Mycobacterium]KUH85562.1 peptidase S15 [Mycobacterium sp. GA-1999]KUH91420.1 peptidase S15 [Mycobacterium sp. GA-0227b]KUH96326.1 peptidase S15 [Mycobacterium sp. IS-1556]